MIKKFAFAALVALASSGAYADPACTGAAGPGTAIPDGVAGTDFVAKGFRPSCSANSLVEYSQTATSFAVGSGSTKGKSTFYGSSNGGGITKSADECPVSGCTATEVGAALAEGEAITGGGSS